MSFPLIQIWFKTPDINLTHQIMKKHINKILILFVAAILTVACDKDYDYTILNSNAELAVSTSATAVELTKDNIGTDIFTISWTEPEYGFSNENPNYKILFDLEAGNFSEAKPVATTTELSKTFKVEELNKILLNLGLAAGSSYDIQMKVIASIGQKNIESVIKTVTVTPFANILDLSTPWSVVGSAITGDDAGWGMDLPLFTTKEDNVFVAYVTFFDGEFKIRKDKDWAEAYGNDGNNIAVTAGSYKVTFDYNTKLTTIAPFSWGIVGDATPNGWPELPTDPEFIPDEKFTYDQYSDTWKVIIALTDGNIKFRQNNDWTVNYGYSGVEGILGGDDIPVTAGNYIVTLDLNKSEYTLEKIDHIWGIVGDATPIGWPGDTTPPDAKLTIDFSTSDVWVIRNFTLKDGNIKFRADDDWGVNYGYSGVEGILGGDDIPVTAGTYDIFLNVSALTYELVKL